MANESRAVVYDSELQLEAYHFSGIMQKFPNHFHDYYVIGFIERGRRALLCKGREYTVEQGDLLLFNPFDNHACEQIDAEGLDYRCLNIQQDVIRKAVREITGKSYSPNFAPSVVVGSKLVPILRELHQMIMSGEKEFSKEELFFLLLQQLIAEYTSEEAVCAEPEASVQIQAICDHLERHYASRITLDDLSRLTGLSKYYLLRCFTKQKGISPYSYLETIRIGKAKKLLERGVAPAEAALQTGFADQSHFSNFFKTFIGLTPGQYMKVYNM